MLHNATIDVPLLRSELYREELVVGEAINIHPKLTGIYFQVDIHVVLGPSHIQPGRMEPSHKTDERVFSANDHIIFGVEENSWRNWGRDSPWAKSTVWDPRN